MPVVDKLTNGSLYNDRAAVDRFSSRAAFSKLRVNSVPFIMPILTIIHRTM